MKAISTGNTYKIYDDSLKSYNELPAQVYSVRFSEMSGFYLEKHADIEVNEDKIYGIHNAKADKVLVSFEKFERSMGVILSGNKGIGKSLFAKIVSIEGIKKGLPVIVVDSYIPSISSFIESIEQEVIVLFDEFDKTFCNDSDEGISSQVGMLSLFDGISQGKKLFIITCNQLEGLNEYLVNRPGRFHYHFRFEYPSSDEIREYLQDKVKPEFWDQIEPVISFACRIDLNYDCLRAIAFELNQGESFEDAIKDLNIVNIEKERYLVTLYYEDGSYLQSTDVYMDMFDNEAIQEVYLSYGSKYSYIDVEFNIADAIYDPYHNRYVIKAEDITLSYDEPCDDERQKLHDRFKKLSPTLLSIIKSTKGNIRYAV